MRIRLTVFVALMTAATGCGPTSPKTVNNNNTNNNGQLCGNGMIDDGEDCDGANLNGQDCMTITGHTSGTVTCDQNCQFDPSACHTCGDGLVTGTEPCDGANLNGMTCLSVGRDGGDLACLADCSDFDLTNCSPCTLDSRTCSADLQRVINCLGETVETCPGDQACENGVCGADPCDAAATAQSSYGCEYWALKPDIIMPDGYGACFAVYVANTWSSPVFITVEYQGQVVQSNTFIQIPQGQGQSLTYTPYDPVNGLPEGSVAIVFLSHQSPQQVLPNCPFPPAVDAETSVPGTGMGSGFRITTDRPVVAYSIVPYGGGSAAATSASLLLPVSAWGDNYVAVNAYEKSVIVVHAQPSLDIIAYQDDTEVTLLPKVPIVGGGGVPAAPANQPVVFNLDAGEYVQISQDQELTGSPIQSDKPVGVWGGASCLNITPSTAACDTAHQQIPPVWALGNLYAGVRYRNRAAAGSEETPPWRIVGAVDGTQLNWTPSAPAGAPTVINQGDVAEFNASGPFVVDSQDASHPFYIAQYMTGGGSYGGEGDPEFVNIVPVDQFLDRYVFFTDPTYSETSLVVVRTKSQVTGDFVDVTLDCAGALSGWQQLGDYEYTRIDLVTGNFMDVGNCSNGRHEMYSEAPFGVTVWGWGGYSTLFTQYVSYAYPAGASVKPINDVVVVVVR